MNAMNGSAAVCALSTAFVVSGAITASGVWGGAAAQEESYFVRDRNVSVAERTQPGYRPEGLRAGQFILRPQVDVGLGYVSNVFALSDSDVPALEQYEDESSLFGILRGSLTGQSDWNRHEVSFDAYVEGFANEEFSEQGFVNAGLGVGGVLDVTRGTEVFGGLSYDTLNESRLLNNVNIVATEPIAYDLARGEVGVRREVGRTRASVRLDVADYDYDDVEIITFPGFDPVTNAPLAISSGTADQDFRDHTGLRLRGEVGVAVSPDTAVFVRAAVNRQEFDGRDALGFDRDSDGWRGEVGAEFDITRLVRGEVAVGYFEQEFEEGTFETVSGVAVDAALEWFPTELTTVSAIASRGARQSPFIAGGGIVASEITLRADHELRRDTLLYAFAGYAEDEWEDIDQTFERARAGVGGRYYFSPQLSVAADYLYTTQDVAQQTFEGGFGQDYNVHQATITVSLTP